MNIEYISIIDGDIQVSGPSSVTRRIRTANEYEDCKGHM